MDDSYRDFIIKTILFLDETSGNLFAQILNISAHNELPLLRENFEDGEIFKFNIEIFEDSKDENVLKLVDLYKNIETERLNMILINNVTDEEMDNFYENSEDDFDDDATDMFGDLPLFLN